MSQNSTHTLENSFWSFLLRKFRVSILLMIAILFMGVYSSTIIPQEVNPEIKVPIAIISTFYQGASPQDVESLVTDKIESRIKNVENIDTITSMSSEGVSSITVNFEADADLDKSIRLLREEVDKVSDLPEEVETPSVTEVSFSDTPIITMSFSGAFTEEDLKSFGEIAEDTLEKVQGISEVNVSGIRDKEIHVQLRPEDLELFSVTPGEVISTINQNNANFPVGTVLSDTSRYSIRVNGELKTADEIAMLPLRSTETGFLRVRDVASVSEGFTRRSSIARVSSQGEDSRPSISLSLFKKDGGNTIAIIESSRKAIEELYENGTFPASLAFETTNDTSEFIREDLDTLINSGVQTVILIWILLMIVLGFKAAFIAATSIPLVFCMAMIGLNYLGFTLNSMTLFSLVLSLGLLVDTSIIMLEGFHENYAHKGKNAYESALESIYTYRWPLLSGTLTTISAFVPMFLVSGIMGEFLSVIPWTIIITLSSSLLVALGFSTTIAFLFFRGKPYTPKVKKKKSSLSMAPFKKAYENFLSTIIAKRGYRWLTIFCAIIAFIGAFSLPITGALGIQMFPPVDVNYFTVSIEAPTGTILDETDRLAKDVEKILQSEPLISNYVITIGSRAFDRGSVISNPGGSAGNSHIAGVSINLVDKADREKTSTQIIAEMRKKFEAITTLEVSITEAQAGPPTGAPIEIRITGPDLGPLEQLAREVKQNLQEVPGAVEIEDDIETGTGEFLITLDRERMSEVGLSIQDVTNTLRTSAFGIEASTIRRDGEDIDVAVEYAWKAPEKDNDMPSPQALFDMNFVTRTGEIIGLTDIADIDLSTSYTSIEHYELDRIIRVRAQTDGRPVIEIVQELQERITDLEIPSGYAIVFGGENEDTEQSFRELFTSMIVGVLLIAFILVLQFNSFVQPFIIMFTVPLSLIGVFSGLTLFGFFLSFPAFIGVVSLAGIVVNDAIVLIDRINNNRRAHSMPFLESIVEGTIARLQPIFLTSLTTIVGLIPLSLSDPVWGGLGFSIIFGLSFATVLVLLFVPVLYTMFEGRAAKKSGEWV